MSDDESVASIELGQEVEDDEQQGSPKSVAWKYAWSMESSQAVSVNGAGNAASERLYKGARSQRETRERLQRMELKRQDYKAGPHKPAINKNSAAMAETRRSEEAQACVQQRCHAAGRMPRGERGERVAD